MAQYLDIKSNLTSNPFRFGVNANIIVPADIPCMQISSRVVGAQKLVKCIENVLPIVRSIPYCKAPKTESMLAFDDIEICSNTLSVRRNEQGIYLGVIEFRILRYLLENPNQIITRDSLIRVAKEDKINIEPSTIDRRIKHLRWALLISLNIDMISINPSNGYSLNITTEKFRNSFL